MSAGRHAWLHSGESAAVRGCVSAGGLSRVAGLAGLCRVVWMHRVAGLLAEVSGWLAA